MQGTSRLTHSIHQPSMLASKTCCLLACVHGSRQCQYTANDFLGGVFKAELHPESASLEHRKRTRGAMAE